VEGVVPCPRQEGGIGRAVYPLSDFGEGVGYPYLRVWIRDPFLTLIAGRGFRQKSMEPFQYISKREENLIYYIQIFMLLHKIW